jgi:transglutaminase-like putative cysteine protease
MTADPKAPGAAAVYLYREETTDDHLHFHSLYVRIKVLTEKGKELATVQIPYDRTEDKVTDIQGRTIHADGTVVPLAVKPTDLIDAKTKDQQRNMVVFTLPSVEVGSILEFRLVIRYPDSRVSSPQWMIQQEYFVHKAHYKFRPLDMSSYTVSDADGNSLSRLMYSWRFHSDSRVTLNKLNGDYTLDIAEIPPLPDEDWMPPLNGLRWEVEFYYTSATSGDEYWKQAGKRWARRTEAFLDVNGELKKVAAGLVSPADSDLDKAKKIYAAVQKLENTSFTREKSEAERKREKLKQIKRAEDVWKQGAGSPDELALLYVALAQAAGLKAWPMQVVNRDRAVFDQGYLRIWQLDDYMAVVAAGGKEIDLDPGEKMCPFGQTHWKHALVEGLRLSDHGQVFEHTPALSYTDSAIQRQASLKVDAQGAVTGVVRVVMSGPEALDWRQKSLENDPEEVKKKFNEWIRHSLPDGVEGAFDHFLALDDYEKNLIATVNVTGTLGSVTGKRFFLPGEFFAAHANHPFIAQDKREIAIDMHYPLFERDTVAYELPEGYAVESLPASSRAEIPQSALFKIEAVTKENKAEVVRTLAYNFTLFDPKLYGTLHDFYQKVAAADQQPLVLVKTAASKGGAQ